MENKRKGNRQKQPSRGGLSNRCSESDFVEIRFRLGCSLVNFQHIFKTPFSKNPSGWLF